MNIKPKNYIIFALLFTTNILVAQSDRMTRDIEVAENILSTLVQQESNVRFGNNVEGTYIEGHGAMFTIGRGSAVIAGNNVLVYGYGSTLDLRDKDKKKNPIDQDSLRTATQANIKNIMKIFLTDYAHLLGQLKPDEKILLRYGVKNVFSGNAITLSRTSVFTTSEDQENMPQELTAEISKSAIDDYRNGKLTKAQLEERIKFTEKTGNEKKDTELELLCTIFHRLYQGDLSKVAHMMRMPHYEKIEGLGAVLNMDFGMLVEGVGNNTIYYFEGRDLVRPLRKRTEDDKNVEIEDEEDLKERYAQFKEGFLENIIEYGRTVKNLMPDEVLLFKLDIAHGCVECGLPSAVELSVKKSVLEDYDKNKISLEQAIEKITVKSNEKQD